MLDYRNSKTYLRTQGKALRIDTITKTFVMTPVAITEICWME